MRCGPLYYRKEGILMIPNFVAMAISSQEPTLLLVSNKNAGSGQVRVFCTCVESLFSSKSRSALRIKDPEVRKSDLAESAFFVMTRDVGTRLFQGGRVGERREGGGGGGGRGNSGACAKSEERVNLVLSAILEF